MYNLAQRALIWSLSAAVMASSLLPTASSNARRGVAVTLIERSKNCGTDCGILALQNGGNTVVGCDFQGGNSTAGSQRIGTNQGQFLIFISSNNDTVEGNTLENTRGNSAVQVNSDYTGILPANFMIQYNTFSHNAYYGPEVDVATSGTIQNNLQTDGAMDRRMMAVTIPAPMCTMSRSSTTSW